MKGLVRCVCMSAMALVLGGMGTAEAQQDYRGLYNRLDALERRITQLQQGGGVASGATASPATMAQLQVQVQSLSEQLRQMNGMLEEINYRQEQLERRWETLQAAQAPAGPGVGVAGYSAAVPGGAAMAQTMEETALPSAAGYPSQPMPISQAPMVASSTLAGVQPVAPVDPAAAAQVSPPLSMEPQKDAGTDYNRAFQLLSTEDYAQAEQAFLQFIADYPDHPLMPNAHYWLGETYYAQRQYADAANQFRLGYEVNSKSGKAPDNLLKLAITLMAMEKVGDGCVVLKELLAQYPDAPTTTLLRASQERERFQCDNRA